MARFLTPREVADLAGAALAHRPVGPVLTELERGYRGYAGAGVICTAKVAGLDVEISDPTIPAGLRAALIPWRQVAQLVADAATPGRLDALATALASNDRSACQAAADAIVLGGPAAIQLDLLDALATLGDQTQPQQRPGQPRRTRRPSRTTTPGADSTGGAA